MSSLLEEVQPNRPEPKEPESAGPATKLVGAVVSGVHTDLVVTRYTDNIFVCVTQLGKLGTIVQVERDQVRAGEEGGKKVVYSSTVLLGQDSEEIQFLARVLAERSQLNKPMVLCVGIKGLSIKLALELVDFVMQNL
jgi:hypothetical protein